MDEGTDEEAATRLWLLLDTDDDIGVIFVEGTLFRCLVKVCYVSRQFIRLISN
jgi:hypothetical protein